PALPARRRAAVAARLGAAADAAAAFPIALNRQSDGAATAFHAAAGREQLRLVGAAQSRARPLPVPPAAVARRGARVRRVLRALRALLPSAGRPARAFRDARRIEPDR